MRNRRVYREVKRSIFDNTDCFAWVNGTQYYIFKAKIGNTSVEIKTSDTKSLLHTIKNLGGIDEWGISFIDDSNVELVWSIWFDHVWGWDLNLEKKHPEDFFGYWHTKHSPVCTYC